MTESPITRRLMTVLRKELRGAKVLKHSDRSTQGVPDTSVTWAGYTNWIEDKHLRKGEKLRKTGRLSLQLITCHELSVTSNGRCWIIVFEDEPRRMTIWTPQTLMSVMWPRMVRDPRVFKGLAITEDPHYQPFEIDTTDGWDLATLLKAHGAIRFPAWNFSAVSSLVTDALEHRHKDTLLRVS